jgi:hypothetical protein
VLVGFISHNKFKGLGISLYRSRSTVICGTIELVVSMDQVGLLLGAFAKLRKATSSFMMSVRLSVHMEQLGSPCTDFHKFF